MAPRFVNEVGFIAASFAAPVAAPTPPPLVPRSWYVAINGRRHKLLLDRDPVDGRDLASQPTLSRFENGGSERTLSDGRSLGGRRGVRARNCDAGLIG
jgi:hypothetical protein